MQVHDELVFEVPRAAVPDVTAAVRECMVDAAALSVPLRVDVGSGRTGTRRTKGAVLVRCAARLQANIQTATSRRRRTLIRRLAGQPPNFPPVAGSCDCRGRTAAVALGQHGS